MQSLTQQQGTTAQRADAGLLPDGRMVESITLRAPAAAIEVEVLAYGATLWRFCSPDREGQVADVTLGHDTPGEYQHHRGYLGVTVGRYANRIAGGRFELDSVEYRLECNDGANALHGGAQGFDTQLWQVAQLREGDIASVTFTHHSPDGEGGYPGAVDASVSYALDAAGVLTIAFAATVSAPTVLNMTNHALW
ncbi:MAG TPA: galactose-1-epimerase, partial [Novosphingobium sp.]|nr:galactose-1-epimerase [Novosphingobium sp.]